MAFQTFRATKTITVGQLRKSIRVGDLVEFDGVTTRVDGVDYRLPTMDGIIANKWLVPLDGPTALVVAETQLPAPPMPALPPLEDEKKIPFASPEAKAANGKRPKANQQHVWGGGTPNAPSWLNGGEKGERTCVVCGVTERFNLIRVDRKRGDGSQQIHYVDAHGNAIVALEELGCPVYLGDPGSAAAYAKDQVRKVRGRVDDVEGHLVTVDERLAQLEADNEFFRQRLIERPAIDAAMVAEALLILAGKDGQAPALTETVRALLAPTLDLGSLRPEADPVMAEVFHPEGTDDPDSHR